MSHSKLCDLDLLHSAYPPNLFHLTYIFYVNEIKEGVRIHFKQGTQVFNPIQQILTLWNDVFVRHAP